MSKKKKRKDSENEEKNYSSELSGLLLILVSIIGFGRFGIVGEIISGFSIFLAGSWWVVGLILLFLSGAYMTIKREHVNIFSSKLVGSYLIIIGVLVLSHIKYVTNNNLEVIATLKDTLDQLILAFKGSIEANGGGIIGAIFSLLFEKLFAITGAKIVSFALIFFGLIIMFNVSIINFLKNLFSKIKNLSFKREFKKEGIDIHVDEPGDSEDVTNKKIITSLDELDEETIETEEVSDTPSEVINYDDIKTDSYVIPDFRTLLNKPSKSNASQNKNDIKENVIKMEKVLADFDIVGKVVAINVGPSVTQYEIELRSGTKVNKVLSIQREIALALAAKDVRIQAPIPGKSTIGIELPNRVNTSVSLSLYLTLNILLIIIFSTFFALESIFNSFISSN